MFERFDQGAREVVTRAQENSRALMHNYIGTEHVLLALLDQEGSIAYHVLKDCKIDKESAEALVLKMVGQGDEPTEGVIPFTPRVKKSFELALRDALSDGANLLTPEYLLLGLMREQEGIAARVVRSLGDGTSYEDIKRDIKQMYFPTSQVLINAQIQRQVGIRDQAVKELDRLQKLLEEAEKNQSQE